MSYFVLFVIGFVACTIGSICGIGGGIILKPVLDALNIIPANTINFLSACMVASMSFYNVTSVFRNKKESYINFNLSTFLAIGAAIGGVCGNIAYSYLRNMFSNPDIVSGYQAIALFIIVLLTLLYTLKKKNLKSLLITNKPTLTILGFSLGMLSSFLGIGGGPMNLAVLCYFLSMTTQEAVQNSLYIILISQITNICLSLINRQIPADFYETGSIEIWILFIGMIFCGICGGIVGKKINSRISEEKLDKLFIALIYVILIICIYNIICKF